MKIVYADTETMREWRANASHLVEDDGTISGLVDPSLESPLAAITRTARMKIKTQEQTVKVGRITAAIRVEVTRTGRGNDEYVMETTVDGKRVVSGREIVAARLLDEYGSCQLRARNGLILKVIQDPRVKRPTHAEALRTAPPPQNCECRTWGKAHPGVHYATCQWNRLAPPEEQAPTGPTEEEMRTLPRQAFASLARSPGAPVISSRPDPKEVVKEADPLDPPDACRNECLSWATPKGVPVPAGQHHPTCVFARRWQQKTSREIPRWLVDLKSGERVRPATDEECGKADVEAKRSGSPIVHVNDVPYAVVVESELAFAEFDGKGVPEKASSVS
jgi:hypothetical protein